MLDRYLGLPFGEGKSASRLPDGKRRKLRGYPCKIPEIMAAFGARVNVEKCEEIGGVFSV